MTMKAAKKPSNTPEKNREELGRMAGRLGNGLRDSHKGYIYVSESDAETLILAIQAYLSGSEKSLDAAFGVKRKPGRPKRGPDSQNALELAERAMFRGPKSWGDIAEETGRDVRGLQRNVDRHGHLVIEKVARKIADSLNEKKRKQ